MRLITVISMLILSVGFTNKKNTITIANELNGTWIPTKQEFGGKEFPASVYEKQTLTINDNKYTVVAESTDKGELTYEKGKMDIYGKEGVNVGKHFMAIYKMENNKLTICYNLAGDSYPETFETKAKTMLFLSEFKKEQTK